MKEKWPRFGGAWPSSPSGWAVNWVDWLRTSADNYMWSGWRAVVMVDEFLLVVVVLRLSVVSCNGQLGYWSRRVPPSELQRTRRKTEFLVVKLGFPNSRCHAVVSDVICVRSYAHFVYVCVYMCMCVSVRTCIYIYIYVHACMYMYMYAFIHMCTCMCTHIWV